MHRQNVGTRKEDVAMTCWLSKTEVEVYWPGERVQLVYIYARCILSLKIEATNKWGAGFPEPEMFLGEISSPSTWRS